MFAFVCRSRQTTAELVEMWAGVKNFWLPGRVYRFWKIVPLSHTKFVQVVQNQNVNIVKTRLVFPTIDGNAETLSGGFNDLFSGCWVYWLFVKFWLPGKFQDFLLGEGAPQRNDVTDRRSKQILKENTKKKALYQGGGLRTPCTLPWSDPEFFEQSCSCAEVF